MSTPESFTIPVSGGDLAALRWGTPRTTHTAVALHGITSNAMAWGAVARHLPESWSLVAVDLRGRGYSRDLPGPYAGGDLARDARDALHATGAEVLAGHSLGAYIALATDHEHPGVAQRLVLVDGGLPLPVPADVDPDAFIDAAIGPMIERLRQPFPSLDAYVDFFRAHPAMGPYWNDDVHAYAARDAIEIDGVIRARAQEEPVRTSGRELVMRVDDVAAALAGLHVPAHLLVATRGMFDQPGGFMPADAVTAALAASQRLSAEVVPDTNHYTVLFAEHAAAAVAAAISGTTPPSGS